MLRTTWADESKATRQILNRTVWEDVVFTDPERGVTLASLFPTVGTVDDKRGMDFGVWINSPLAAGPIHPDDLELPMGLQRVAVGVRPLIMEWRWMRHGPDEGNATGYGSLPVSQWAWDAFFRVGGATTMWMQTFEDVPVSFQIRYRGGPKTYELGNRVGKAWER